MLPAREGLRRNKLKHSMKMTGILYLPSMAANLSGKDDNITDVWFGLCLFVWVFGGGGCCFLIKLKHLLRSFGCFLNCIPYLSLIAYPAQGTQASQTDSKDRGSQNPDLMV